MSVHNLTASLSSLDFDNEESVVTLKYGLYHVAGALATSTEERRVVLSGRWEPIKLTIGLRTNVCNTTRISVGAQEGFWDGLYRLWRTLTQRCLDAPHPAQHDLDVLSLAARFTRNLVAGVPANQVAALSVQFSTRAGRVS
jgi:hypothetical protein